MKVDRRHQAQRAEPKLLVRPKPARVANDTDILTIEVLSGLDATTQYGGGSTTGVIVISTKNGRP